MALDQRRQSLLFDLTTAATVALLAVIFYTLDPWLVPHGLVMATALIWRRSRPVLTFCVVTALAAAQLLVPDDAYSFVPHDVAVLIAMYSVVKYADPPWRGMV